jgi:hypothetical protein
MSGRARPCRRTIDGAGELAARTPPLQPADVPDPRPITEADAARTGVLRPRSGRRRRSWRRPSRGR